MSNPITEAVIECLTQDPHADNVRVALYVREKVPGAQTTPASVSSIKSRIRAEAKAAGAENPFPNAARGVGGAADGLPMPSWMLPSGGGGGMAETDESESDEEAAARIMVRYKALERNAKKLVDHRLPALIVSGPPGLGKSYEFRRRLKESTLIYWYDIEDQYDAAQDPEGYAVLVQDGPGGKPCSGFYDLVSGSITAVGLYQALWNMRKGGVLVLDDVDDVFRDETSLNLLKAALDNDPEHRRLSWRKEAKWLEDYGIPKTFLFEGSVVFLTNIDFETVINKGHRDAEHFKALIDRSHYLCLTLRTQRDFMIRLRQVSDGENGTLQKVHGLTPEQAVEVMDFIDQNKGRFYNLSLRLVNQVAEAYLDDPDGWKDDIIATKTRTMK